MDRITYEKKIIDFETGEVKKTEIVHKRGVEPTFIKLYLDDLCDFQFNDKLFNPILIELLKYMTYSSTKGDENVGQIVFLNAEIKKKIASATGKTIKTVNNTLFYYIKIGILKRISSGTYQVNPMYFGKGEWRDINNLRNNF